MGEVQVPPGAAPVSAKLAVVPGLMPVPATLQTMTAPCVVERFVKVTVAASMPTTTFAMPAARSTVPVPTGLSVSASTSVPCGICSATFTRVPTR